jgi:CheY-like chemotaxis protein
MSELEPPSDRPIYGIGAVSRMVGVPAATIRNWEERYAHVRPARSAGGQRLYSRNEVERLRFLRDEMEAGASAADAHRLLAERLAADEPISEPDADAPRLVILLAERDPYAAELAEYFLRTEGFAVEVASTPADALAAFDATTPALVIVELLLDGGQGLQLCRELKRRGALAVLATSPLRIEDLAADAGLDAFLAKPFDPLELVAAVKDLLTRSAILRSAAMAEA